MRRKPPFAWVLVWRWRFRIATVAHTVGLSNWIPGPVQVVMKLMLLISVKLYNSSIESS